MATDPPLSVLALGPWLSLGRLARAFQPVSVAVTHQPDLTWAVVVTYDLVLVDVRGLAREVRLPLSEPDAGLLVAVRHHGAAVPPGVDHVLDEDALESMLPIVGRLCQQRARARRLAHEKIALIDANPDAVLVVDGNGLVRYVNAAAQSLFGRTAHELLAEPLGFSVADGVVTEIEVGHGARMRRVEMRVATIQWEGTAASLATLRDVTEQRLMDDRLRQSQKLEAIGRLASGIAHDFNNLLQGVIGNLEIVGDEMAPGSIGEECITTALHAALRGVELTARLLSLARRHVPWARPVDLWPLLREVRAMMARIATGRPRIDIEIERGLGWVLVDPVQLETALLNLLGNAADVTPPGGTIRIDASRRLGGTGHRRTEAEYVVLTVTDHGAGMDPETARQAFDPFFTTKGLGGTGLGLSMVKEFADSAGGEVVLHTAPGRGTRVELWLPALMPDDQLAH